MIIPTVVQISRVKPALNKAVRARKHYKFEAIRSILFTDDDLLDVDYGNDA